MGSDKRIGHIKCPKCGETYTVAGGDLEKEYIHYSCDKCGSDISVDFFVCCSVCNEYVGASSEYSLKQMAKDFGKGYIDTFIHPIDTIKSFGHMFDKVPYSHGVANCHFCGTKYARCPNCHSGVEVGDGIKAEDVLFCTECGQKFRLQ